MKAFSDAYVIPSDHLKFDDDFEILDIESFPDQKLASGHHGDSWRNKPAKRDDRVSPLSPH